MGENNYDVFGNDEKKEEKRAPSASDTSNQYYSTSDSGYEDAGGSKLPTKWKKKMKQDAKAKAQAGVQPGQDGPKPKRPFYHQWWFWVIVAFVLIVIVVSRSGSDKDNTSDNTTTTTTQASTVAKVYTVPDGAEVKEVNGTWGLYQNNTLVEGYTGIAVNSFGNWYIVNGLVDFTYNGNVKDGSKEYQVNNGKAVEFSNGTTAAPPVTPDQYKAQCRDISYEDIARNPDNFKGQKVKFYGKVLQVQTAKILGGESVVLRVATKDSGYDTWYDDVVYVNYEKKEGESNILEDDMVTLYGVCDGTTTYTTVMGSSVTIPSVNAEYIDIH